MTKSIGNIQLGFSCQEDWHSMASNEKGRLCKNCNSCVIDFTNKSTEELTNEIVSANTPICGSFKKSQLSNSFLKYAASSLLISSIAVPALSQDPFPFDSLEVIEEVDDDIVFGFVMETPPIPRSGWKGFYERLSNEIKVPKNLTVRTRVYIEFKIDTSGNMVDVKVVKGDSPKLNEEALRAINKLSEKFEPGTQRGKPIIVKQVLPIYFDPKR